MHRCFRILVVVLTSIAVGLMMLTSSAVAQELPRILEIRIAQNMATITQYSNDAQINNDFYIIVNLTKASTTVFIDVQMGTRGSPQGSLVILTRLKEPIFQASSNQGSIGKAEGQKYLIPLSVGISRVVVSIYGYPPDLKQFTLLSVFVQEADDYMPLLYIGASVGTSVTTVSTKNEAALVEIMALENSINKSSLPGKSLERYTTQLWRAKAFYATGDHSGAYNIAYEARIKLFEEEGKASIALITIQRVKSRLDNLQANWILSLFMSHAIKDGFNNLQAAIEHYKAGNFDEALRSTSEADVTWINYLVSFSVPAVVIIGIIGIAILVKSKLSESAAGY